MSTYAEPWAFCGGWAVDAWLGAPSRDHADIDIAVFVQDQRALFEHLRGWQLVVHDASTAGDTAQLWDGVRRPELPAHIHARLPKSGEAMPERVNAAAEQGFGLDIQLCEREGDEWLFSREPRVSMPLPRCIAQSPWQLPTAVPEVLLFYKAADLRRRDKTDFMRLLPHLGEAQREWLRSALVRVGHPWLAQLPAAAST